MTKRAISGSLEGINNLIINYFYGSNITLKQENEKEWSLINKNGNVMRHYKVTKKGQRFYFYEL